MSVKVSKNSMSPSLTRIQRELDKLPRQMYDFWVKITPKDTGNAKRKTTFKQDVIHANYAYAERLDNGWSKQAPKGMSEPTSKEFERRVKKILRK